MELIGRTLRGKYRIEKFLGQGGMASVWRGRHELTGRMIAIKVLDERYTGQAGVTQRFYREARSASAIRHPGIVEIIDIDQMEEGVPFMVMEFLEGQSLADRIDHGAPMSETELLGFGSDLLEALHAAHEAGVVHRDLKPDNIFLVLGRKGPVVKILDFGISSKDDEKDTKLTVTGSVLGTPHYMSPEQAEGEPNTDRRVDIYAAGVVLYECACGEVPFDAPNYNKLLRKILSDEPERPRARGAAISVAVEDVILRALSKSRSDRYATALEMRTHLREAVGLQNSMAPESSGGTNPTLTLPKARSGQWDLGLATATAPPRAKNPSSAAIPAVRDIVAPAVGTAALELDEAALNHRVSRPMVAPEPHRASGSLPRVAGTKPHERTDPAIRTLPRSAPELPAARPREPSASSDPSEGTSLNVKLGIAVVLTIGLIGGLWAYTQSQRPVPPVTAPVDTPVVVVPPRDRVTTTTPTAAFVNVIIEITPEVPVRMRLDGIAGATSPLRVRAGTSHQLEVQADGFQPVTVEVQADRDRRIRIALER